MARLVLFYDFLAYFGFGLAIAPSPVPHFLQKRSFAPWSLKRLPTRTPRRHDWQNSRQFEALIGISLESRPPCGLRRLGLTCLYTRLTPSTTTLPSLGSTRNT